MLPRIKAGQSLFIIINNILIKLKKYSIIILNKKIYKLFTEKLL